ncbi:putative ribonuclease P [Helianthus anomalus]
MKKNSTKTSTPATKFHSDFSTCSKNKDFTGAITLFDYAISQNLKLNLHHLNCFLYICANSTESFGALAIEKGFHIYNYMISSKINPNEATITAVSRLAAANNDADYSFELVKSLGNYNVKPRLRTYDAALFCYVKLLDAEKAYAVENDMVSLGLCLEEPEISALLKVSVEVADAEKVYGYLHKLRAGVRCVGEETVAVIERWFSGRVGEGVGCGVGEGVKEVMVKNGGGWHGLGWLGKGKWVVQRTSVGLDGGCCGCGERLACVDIGKEDTEKFAQSVVALAVEREKRSNFTQFQIKLVMKYFHRIYVVNIMIGDIGYRSSGEISVQYIGQIISIDIINDIDQYITDFPNISIFLLCSAIRLSSYCCYYFYLLQLFVICKLQKVNLLMVGEYTELLVLNCYIYKFSVILKLPISHCDNRYLKCRSLTDIRFFTNWLDQHNDFEAIVDAANIGLYQQNFADGGFSVPQLEAVVKELYNRSNKWPLVILHEKRLHTLLANPCNREILQEWIDNGILYGTPVGSNDDWYWLYASVKLKCMLVTNDEMRDHIFELLGSNFFPRWKERHQVHYAFPKGQLKLEMPPSYSIVIQESERGAWHVPVTGEYKDESQRTWLCVTRPETCNASDEFAKSAEARESGKMINGNYLNPSSNSLNNSKTICITGKRKERSESPTE